MQLTLYIVQLSTNKLRLLQESYENTPGVVSPKTSKNPEKIDVFLSFAKRFPGKTAALERDCRKKLLPFPVQVEGHEISDSLMEFFNESQKSSW